MSNNQKQTLEELSKMTPKEVYSKTSMASYMAEYDFTEKELQAIDKLSKSIDVLDTASLIGYGSEAQVALANFSDKKLASSNTSTLTVAGDDLTNLVTTLKTYDGTPSKNPIIRLIKSKKKELVEFKSNYSSVLDNVKESEKILREQHLQTLASGVAEFDEMYEMNLEYYKTLTMYIMAGKKRLEELRTNDLIEARRKAEASKSQLDSQAVNDLAEAINSFDSKLYALQISRQLVIQQACQIRQLQKTYRDLAEEIVNILNTAIPTWKNLLRLSLGISDANAASNAIHAAIDFTESIIIKNAQQLAQASVDAAKMSNRPIASIQTVQEANNILIDSVEKIINENINKMNEITEGEKIISEIEEKRKSSLLEFSRRIQENSMQRAMGNSASQNISQKNSKNYSKISNHGPILSEILEEVSVEEPEEIYQESVVSDPILSLKKD